MTRRLISLSAAEHALKRQEVILKAMAGEIYWYQAAEILGISPRQMRRWKARYEEHGYDGLLDRRKNTPSPRRIPFDVAQKVLTLYRTEYRGFNITHFHEEITAHHDVQVSYSWVKSLLQESGLVAKASSRGTYRRRRPRKTCTGMMLHLDGSHHRWFRHPHHQRQCLAVVLDDASSEILAARFAPEETARLCLELLQQVVREHGTFASLYTDRASHFVYTPEAGGKPDRSHPTYLEQVLQELGIELIVAYSPEARGRGERMFGTLQGRLPQELGRAGITSYEAANAYLHQLYLPKHNRNFSVEAAEQVSAFLPVTGVELERVFARRSSRQVRRDNTIEYKATSYQLPKVSGIATLANRQVEVREHLDGTVEVLVGRRLVACFEAGPSELEQEQAS